MDKMIVFAKIAREIAKLDNNGNYMPLTYQQKLDYIEQGKTAYMAYIENNKKQKHFELAKNVLDRVKHLHDIHEEVLQRVDEIDGVYTRYEDYNNLFFEIYSYPSYYENDIFFKAWDGMNYKVDTQGYKNILGCLKCESIDKFETFNAKEKMEIRKVATEFKAYIVNCLDADKKIEKDLHAFTNKKALVDKVLNQELTPTRKIEHKPYKDFEATL